MNSKEETTLLASAELRKMIDIGTILECLDGTIYTPNRVLIMTTNHVDKLAEMDAAFLRPGRVDVSLHLGYITPECCFNMLQQEYDDTPLTEDQRSFFRDYVTKKEVTPAMFEAWCIEAPTIDDMIVNLTKMKCKQQNVLS